MNTNEIPYDGLIQEWEQAQTQEAKAEIIAKSGLPKSTFHHYVIKKRIKSIQPDTLVHWFCKIANDHELSPRETQDFSYLVAEHVLSNSPDSELKEITSFLISRLKNTTAIHDHSPRASFWRSLCLLVRGYRVHTFEAREYIPHPSRYNTSRTLESANSRVLECLQILLRSHQPNQGRKS